MIALRLHLAATSLALVAAAPATAQPSRAPAWQMDWGNQYCTLARLPDRATPFTIAFRALPGESYLQIFLAQGTGRPPERAESVVLAPSGRSFALSYGDAFLGDGTRLVPLGGVPLDFLDALSGADQLQLKRADRVVGEAHLADTAAAVRALRQCISDALREWGVDEAAWAAVRRHPASTNALGMNDMDYPREALRQNNQGRVVVRIDVSADGRATACAPVATSHTRVIDAAACSVAMSRGRFRPALDAAGQPTAGQIVTTVAFLMPH